MTGVAALIILGVLTAHAIFRGWCLQVARQGMRRHAVSGPERPIQLWQRTRDMAPPVTIISVITPDETDAEARVRRLTGLSYPGLSAVVAVPRTDRVLVRQLADAFDLEPVAGRFGGNPLAPEREVLGGGTGALRVVALDACRDGEALNACLAEVQTPFVFVILAKVTPHADALMRAMETLLSGDPQMVAVAGVAEGERGATGRQALIDRRALARLGLLAPTAAPFAMIKSEAVLAAGGFAGRDVTTGLHTLARVQRVSPGATVGVATEARCPIERHQPVGRNAAIRSMLWRHCGALGRTRYGRFGTLTMPLLMLDTVLAPAAEVAALFVFAALVWSGGSALAFAIAVLGLSLSTRLATQITALCLQIEHGEVAPSLQGIVRLLASEVSLGSGALLPDSAP